MTRINFSALFFSQKYNRDSFVNSMDGLLGAEPHILNIIPYASEKPPHECFGNNDPNRVCSCIYSEDGISLLKLTFQSPRIDNEAPIIEGNFFVYEYPDLPNVFVLMTIEPQDFIRRALLPFIEHNHPRIFLTVVGQHYMNSLLHEFKDGQKFTDLRVVRSVLRSRFSREKPRRETIIPSVSWPYLGLDGAFDYAHEQNGWFQSLTFEALRNSKVIAEITVSRNGIIKTDGQLTTVFDGLVSPICKTAYDNYELFKNRSRRDNPSLNVRPLTISFNKDQLSDEEEILKLVEAMRLLDKASLSVVHNNPYLQLSVIDYLDGSTFDLWVLNPKELIIVPQLKGTVSALRRLVSHVFDNYAEGQIEDFQLVR